MRSEFNSLHPYQIRFGSRGLKHDDASVLTKRSGLESRRELQRAGSVTNNTAASEAADPGLTPGPPAKLRAKGNYKLLVSHFRLNFYLLTNCANNDTVIIENQQ